MEDEWENGQCQSKEFGANFVWVRGSFIAVSGSLSPAEPASYGTKQRGHLRYLNTDGLPIAAG